MALITTATNLDYLITPLRLHINDMDEPYTFSDDRLRTNLVYAVKALMPRWNNRYIINVDTNYIERNPNHVYQFPEPPILQAQDERAVILQAAIDIKSPYVYNSSKGVVSWKDDEVSFSNISSVQSLESSLKRDLEELNMLFPSASKRLAQPIKQSLLGFDNPPNQFEG